MKNPGLGNQIVPLDTIGGGIGGGILNGGMM